MCLSIPGKVLEVGKEKARIDYGEQEREAGTDLVNPKVGDFVLVQLGYVVEILEESRAKEMQAEWEKAKL